MSAQDFLARSKIIRASKHLGQYIQLWFGRRWIQVKHIDIVVVGVAIALCTGHLAWGASPNTLVGAIRFDAWYPGTEEERPLEQPAWQDRVPFFALRNDDGKYVLNGDKSYVLKAEVAYARSIGLDYFIFGFYPDTGSWGRSRGHTLALDRALSTYLALPDRMGVRFAIALNQLFPNEDVPDIGETLAKLTTHPDYVRAQGGAVPVFILGLGGDTDLARFFGNDEKARAAVATLRRIVREQTGREIIFILLNFNFAKAWDSAVRFGLDMVSTYSDFAPNRGVVEVPYGDCVNQQIDLWQRAQAANVPYLPNVTLGWDNRPQQDPAFNAKPVPSGPWCAAIDPPELDRQFAAAYNAVAQGPQPRKFQSIIIYAWNEFTEGGWMPPTRGAGESRLLSLRHAIDKARPMPNVLLTWPTGLALDACPVRLTGRSLEEVKGKCPGAVTFGSTESRSPARPVHY